MPVVDDISLRGLIPGVKRGRNIELRPMDGGSRAREKGSFASGARYSVYGKGTQGFPGEYEMQRGREPVNLTLLANALKDG